MRKLLVALTVLLVSPLLTTQIGLSQSTQGRWALGLYGGGNLWLNDLNNLKIGSGGDVVLRYGLTRNFSLGLMAGFHDLKSQQEPPFPGQSFGYIKLSSFPVAMVGYFHLAPRNVFNPYIYIGGGALIYQRGNSQGAYFPDNKFRVSYMVPVGIGFDAFTSRNISINIDAGFRNFDDGVDLNKNNSLDGMFTAMIGVSFFFGSSDADDDDKDGLTNAQERRFGTNPNNPDTDRDGLLDGEELRRYKTNPLKADTDMDGLSDGDEAKMYTTDPAKWDTDGDGLSDGDEVMKYRTDPLRADTDQDGLNDGDEVLRHKTDPLKVDSDGDGLSDYDEVIIDKTDPNNPDTDGDGLQDGDEVKKFKTDPRKADTDGGGVNDGVEVKRGTNPLDPQDDGVITLERGKTVVLQGVNFASGSAKLTKDSEITLSKAQASLLAQPTVNVEIAGYTDNYGHPETNRRLSLQRAQSVKNWLTSHGIPSGRLTVVGRGDSDPIAPNSTPEGRAKNRRIEFHVK
jgi:outer membrane protein OmpA-like peptidoglycan-associated protein